MKKQVVVIHGGDPGRPYREYLNDLKAQKVDVDDFKESRGWKKRFQEDAGADFEVFNPEMPNIGNAKYSEWKIWFEKMIPFLRADAIFIGHSLGGIFLAKYFSENLFPCKPRALFLVAAPYKKKGKENNTHFGGFGLKDDISLIAEQTQDVYLYHSKDDPVASFSYMKKFQEKLPSAKGVVFDGKGHFITEKFPEIIKAIQSLS